MFNIPHPQAIINMVQPECVFKQNGMDENVNEMTSNQIMSYMLHRHFRRRPSPSFILLLVTRDMYRTSTNHKQIIKRKAANGRPNLLALISLIRQQIGPAPSHHIYRSTISGGQGAEERRRVLLLSRV